MSIVVAAIFEYLQSNRRLVVPGFGAFVVKESGERVFSDLLRTDDGVLSSLLRSRGLNEMESAITIDRFIFEIRHNLESYGYYRLGDIGTLRVEPSTKTLRLYPPVQGEMPKAKPYIPQPIVDEGGVEKGERGVVEESVSKKIPASDIPVPTNATAVLKRTLKPRKRFDFVMVVAIIIVLAAVAAIGYGYYVSTLADMDDAAIDALRVVPGQTINELE